MYEAMRRRAPFSTHAAGLSATLIVMAVAGYLLATGLGAKIVAVVQPPTILVTLPPKAVEPPPEQRQNTPAPETLGPTIIPPIPVAYNFFADDETFKVDPGPVAPSEGKAPTLSGVPSPVRVAPNLSTREKPLYPAASIRGDEQGTTGLELCIDAKGRVTSARLAQSSGYSRLDAAALQWVRGVRFTPGTTDGAPETVCGHTISYQWKLEGRR